MVSAVVLLTSCNAMPVNSYLVCTHYDCGQDLALALHFACNGTSEGRCPSRAAIALVCQIVLVVVFLSLLLTATHLAECYGDEQYKYDLGNDLDSLWAESQNVLESRD